MNAIVLQEAGGTENLMTKELPVPSIKEEEVLISVKAISINPIDIKTRSGKGLYTALKNETPLILGWDISGRVVETGKRVSIFKQGDEVFGMINFPGHGKAYAEYVAAPANQLAKKPSGVSHQEAAAASLAALTAWQALHAFISIHQGQRVLIHAAAGGVGHFAVQMARHLGAWVAGTASEANRDFVLGIGADQFIDYTTGALKDHLTDIDFVLDTLGGNSIDHSLEVMKKGATIVSIPTGRNEAVAQKAATREMLGHTFVVRSNGTDMKTIASLLEQEIIHSHISNTYDFSKMAAAHAQIETGHTRGKIAVSFS